MGLGWQAIWSIEQHGSLQLSGPSYRLFYLSNISSGGVLVWDESGSSHYVTFTSYFVGKRKQTSEIKQRFKEWTTPCSYPVGQELISWTQLSNKKGLESVFLKERRIFIVFYAMLMNPIPPPTIPIPAVGVTLY